MTPGSETSHPGEQTGVGNPLDKVINEGFRVPAWEELTAEQQHQLLNGPGQVEQLVTNIYDFADFEAFRDEKDSAGPKRNNFYLQFTWDRYNATLDEDMRGIVGPRKATRRFQIIFPQLAQDIDSSIEQHLQTDGYRLKPNSLDGDETTLKKLFVAYKLIRQLVDQHDDSGIEADYLTK